MCYKKIKPWRRWFKIILAVENLARQFKTHSMHTTETEIIAKNKEKIDGEMSMNSSKWISNSGKEYKADVDKCKLTSQINSEW